MIPLMYHILPTFRAGEILTESLVDVGGLVTENSDQLVVGLPMIGPEAKLELWRRPFSIQLGLKDPFHPACGWPSRDYPGGQWTSSSSYGQPASAKCSADRCANSAFSQPSRPSLQRLPQPGPRLSSSPFPKFPSTKPPLLLFFSSPLFALLSLLRLVLFLVSHLLSEAAFPILLFHGLRRAPDDPCIHVQADAG